MSRGNSKKVDSALLTMQNTKRERTTTLKAPRRRSEKMVRWYLIVRSFWEGDRAGESRRGVPSSNVAIVVSEDHSLPDAHCFHRLFKIGHVPETGYERLQQCVLFDINHVWRSRSLRLSAELSLRKEPSKKAIYNQLLSVQKLANDLHDELKRLRFLSNFALTSIAKKIYPTTWGPDGEELGFDLNQFKKTVEQVIPISSEAVTVWKTIRRPRERPSQFDSTPLSAETLLSFALRLTWDVEECGGRLTIDKNIDGGTLRTALQLLSPYLPARFVPGVLPLSTLAALKALDRELARKRMDRRSKSPVSKGI
jgi:hypothetical protein